MKKKVVYDWKEYLEKLNRLVWKIQDPERRKLLYQLYVKEEERCYLKYVVNK